MMPTDHLVGIIAAQGWHSQILHHPRANRDPGCSMQWLFLSSGARPGYVENVVKSLALFPGEHLQVRYRDKYVSPKFQAAAAAGTVKNSTVYFAFLGAPSNAGSASIVIVREFIVDACERRGSSYVMRLRAYCYPKDADNISPSERLLPYAFEQPGDWLEKRGGFLVSELTHPLGDAHLVAHGFRKGTHLTAFESVVDKLAAYPEFGSSKRKLFVSTLDILNDDDVSMLEPHRLKLVPGKSYRLLVYHYYNDGAPTENWKPFSVRLEAQDAQIVHRSAQTVTAESEYDEKEFRFQIPPSFEAEFLGLNLVVSDADVDGEQITGLHLNLGVQRQSLGKWVRILIMTGGLVAAQTSVLAATDKLNWQTAVIVLIGSFVAAVAALFNYRKTI